jgi:mannosyltransferase
MSIKEYFRRFVLRGEFLPALTVFTAAALWLPHACESLWRDEAITWWIIKDGWAETFERAFHFQEWSGAYYLFMKAWVSVFGKSEAALRVPSLAAAAAAAYALYLLGKRIKDRETGLLAALVFSTSGYMSFHAADARPYAAALAFGILATLNLTALLDENKAKNMCAYVLFSVLTVYFHIAFAGLLGVHALYGGFRCFKEKCQAGKLFGAYGLILFFLLPLAGPAGRILARSSSLMFAELPSFAALFFVVLPVALAAGIAAGILVSGGGSFRMENLKTAPGSALFLAAGLALLPPLVFFFVARFAGLEIWVPRYFLYSQAGAALCAGLFLRALEPDSARRLAAAGIAVAMLLTYGRPERVNENWRAAAQWAGERAGRPGTPVLLKAPYVESNLMSLLSDPAAAGYLSAPLGYYPVGARVVLLPEKPAGAAEKYASDGIKTAARGASGIVVIGAGGMDYDDWLNRQFWKNKFFRSEYITYGDITSAVFVPCASLPKRLNHADAH